jgi:hypothetical protein
MSTTTTRTRPIALIGALAIPVVLGSLANAIIAALVRAVATIPQEFMPLQPPAYVSLTVLGVAAGLTGWLVVRRVASDAAAVLRVLVPAVLVLSFVPDVLLGAGAIAQPGVTWPGVIGLMIMHVVVAAVAVASFARLLPAAGR